MTIALYCLALLAVGWWSRRAARDAAGYYLAGRRLSAVQVGFTLASTAFGGSAILVASEMVYTRGLAGLWFSGSVALGFAVLGLVFARRIRESGAHSLAHFIGLHYGPPARWFASALIVVVEITFFALTVKSFALMTTPLFAQSRWLAGAEAPFEIGITAVFVIYTLLGGQRAVARTDYLQMIIIAGGLLAVLLPLGLLKTDLSRLPAGFLRLPFAPGAGPLFALNMCAMMGLSGVIGGDVFSKVLSAADSRAARRGALLAAAGMGAFALAIALLALCARVQLPGLDGPQASALANPKVSVLLMARDLLPGALFQIVTLTFLSALLSTGDSVLVTGATVLALDVLKLGEKIPLAAHRLLTLLLAVAGLILALHYQELLEILRFGYTLLVASLVAPVMTTLLVAPRLRVRPAAALAAMAAGLLAAALWKAAPAHGWLPPAWLRYPLDPATLGVAASSAVTLCGLGRAEPKP